MSAAPNAAIDLLEQAAAVLPEKRARSHARPQGNASKATKGALFTLVHNRTPRSLRLHRQCGQLAEQRKRLVQERD
jgi:hypothetical protein